MSGSATSARIAWLERLFREEHPRLLGRLRGWLGSDSAAEDAAQDAFVRLAGDTRLTPEAVRDPGAYLARTARNCAIDRLRTAVGREAHLSDEIGAALVCPAPDPENAAAAQQRAQRFTAALASLPARSRDMVVAARLHGEGYASIAQRHGTSRAAVEKTVARALRRLAAAAGEPA